LVLVGYCHYIFFFQRSLHHRDLHSFPTRRSSDLHVDVERTSKIGRRRDRHQTRVVIDVDGVVDCFGGGLGGVKKIRVLVLHIRRDRKSTRLNSSHLVISYAVFCLKKKNKKDKYTTDTRTISITLCHSVNQRLPRTAPPRSQRRTRHPSRPRLADHILLQDRSILLS